jgi:hypothetical protein
MSCCVSHLTGMALLMIRLRTSWFAYNKANTADAKSRAADLQRYNEINKENRDELERQNSG